MIKIMDSSEIQKLEGQRIGILVLERGVVKILDVEQSSLDEVQKFVTENVMRYHEQAQLIGVYESMKKTSKQVSPPIDDDEF